MTKQKLPSADPNNADSRSATAVMEPPTSESEVPAVDTTDPNTADTSPPTDRVKTLSAADEEFINSSEYLYDLAFRVAAGHPPSPGEAQELLAADIPVDQRMKLQYAAMAADRELLAGGALAKSQDELAKYVAQDEVGKAQKEIEAAEMKKSAAQAKIAKLEADVQQCKNAETRLTAEDKLPDRILDCHRHRKKAIVSSSLFEEFTAAQARLRPLQIAMNASDAVDDNQLGLILGGTKDPDSGVRFVTLEASSEGSRMGRVVVKRNLLDRYIADCARKIPDAERELDEAQQALNDAHAENDRLLSFWTHPSPWQWLRDELAT